MTLIAATWIELTHAWDSAPVPVPIPPIPMLATTAPIASIMVTIACGYKNRETAAHCGQQYRNE